MTCDDRQREMQDNGFVLSRKRAWWMSWLTNEPLTAQSFLDNSGLTKQHMATALKLDSQSWSAKNWHAEGAAAGQGVGRRAKLCAANVQTAAELRTLAQARGLNKTFQTAIAILYGEVPEGTESRWAHEKVSCCALPDLSQNAAKTVESPKLRKSSCTCLRVTLPFLFQRILIETVSSQACKHHCRPRPARKLHCVLRMAYLWDCES